MVALARVSRSALGSSRVSSADELQPKPKAPVSAWSPLRLAVFRNLWIATIISNVGSSMNETAAIWTMTLQSGSPTLVSLMQTMASLPLFFFALPAGALADLIDRRRLIILAQTGAMLTAAGMSVLAYLGELTPPLLLLATFQLGIAAAFTMPTWQALIPEIVGKAQLSAAISLGGVGFNLARSLGPVAGGVLIAWLGPAPVFALNAASFGAVIVALLLTRMDSQPRSPEREQMIGAMAAAIRYVRYARPMRAVLIRAAVHVYAAVAPVALLPVMIRGRGWTGSDYGLLMGCYGLGAILIAIFVLPRWRARFSFDRVVFGAAIAAAVATIGLAFAPGRVGMGAAMMLAGASWMAALNTFSLAAQSAFPNWVRARSSAIYLVAVQGAFGVGALLWGRLTAEFGYMPVLSAAAVLMLMSTTLGGWRPISHLEQLDLTPSNHWPGHSFSSEPGPHDGPVLITLEYRIDPQRAPEFAAAMRILREIRLRDGGFRCSVFRDLDDPAIYRETFLVGSWAEHLRQHQRATVEDRRIEECVFAFHLGSETPRVHHYLMVSLRDAARLSPGATD
jgi:MFS family permease